MSNYYLNYEIQTLEDLIYNKVDDNQNEIYNQQVNLTQYDMGEYFHYQNEFSSNESGLFYNVNKGFQNSLQSQPLDEITQYFNVYPVVFPNSDNYQRESMDQSSELILQQPQEVQSKDSRKKLDSQKLKKLDGQKSQTSDSRNFINIFINQTKQVLINKQYFTDLYLKKVKGLNDLKNLIIQELDRYQFQKLIQQLLIHFTNYKNEIFHNKKYKKNINKLPFYFSAYFHFLDCVLQNFDNKVELQKSFSLKQFLSSDQKLKTVAQEIQNLYPHIQLEFDLNLD